MITYRSLRPERATISLISAPASVVLPEPVALGNYDVLLPIRGRPEDRRLTFSDDPRSYVVIEGIEHLRRFAHRDARMPYHRRHQSLEPDPGEPKLALDNRMVGIGHRAKCRGHGANEALPVAFRQTEVRRVQSLAVRFEPHAPILVDDNFGDRRIGNRGQQLRTELPP